MGLFDALNPMSMLTGGGGGSSSFSSGGIANKSATTANTSSTSNTDSRLVVGNGAFGIGSGGTLSTTSSNSGNFSNSGTYNSTDAVKFIAQMGDDALSKMGASATNIYQQAGLNSATAWGHTLDASEKVLDKLLTTSSQANDAAKVVAQAAIAGYQPADNTLAQTMGKVGIAVAVAVVAFVLMRSNRG